MERISEEALKLLETQHGRIERVLSKARTTRRGKEVKAGEDWEVVYRKPTTQEYKAFRHDSTNPLRAPDAQEILARKLVVHPDKVSFDKLLNEFPGIPAASGTALKRLCGLMIEQFPELSKSKISEDQLDEWESKYRHIAHLMGEDGAWEAVYRIPTRLELKAFRGRAHDDKNKADAVEVLARQCVLFPPKEVFPSLLEEFPGIPEASVQSFMDLAQVEADESGKG